MREASKANKLGNSGVNYEEQDEVLPRERRNDCT